LEDIDGTRVRPEYEAGIFEDLAWLGMRWEEPVRKQSEHWEDYRAALAKLEAMGLLYPCFCTRKAIQEEVARMLGLARKKLPIIKKAIHVHQAAPQTEQADGGWSLGEIVRDDNMKCPAEVLLDDDTLRHVLARIETLDERASKILKLRFGLGGGEPMTLKEIGAVLGLTRERVRQIESETLASLALELEAAPRASVHLRRGA
jgi:RNA polymerase sigma factor (sigma-70 family)